MGGGLSLPSDYGLIRDHFPDALRISANAHGARLTACDYLVVIDDLYRDVREAQIDTPIISQRSWADYRLVEHPYLVDSGAIATWIAWNLGACPILLCGIGCYQDGTYHHDPDAPSRGRDIELEEHLKNWRRIRGELPDGAPIRAVSGPVAQVFGAYRPDEDFSGYVPPDIDELMSKHAGQVVTITATGARVGFDEFEPGQTVELARLDAAELIRLHQAVAA